MYPVHFLSPTTPIDRVLLLLTRRMGLDNRFDYKIKRWLGILKENWICTFGGILRAPEGTFDNLGLPLALAGELNRIQALPSQHKNENFFTIQKVCKSSAQIYSTKTTKEITWLKISDIHRELVLKSFNHLVSYKSPEKKSGVQLFEEQFFHFFLTQNPGVQRFFDSTNLSVAGRAFKKMLYWIIENVDNVELSAEVLRVGGQHSIYGVTEGEMKSFVRAVCHCIKAIVSPHHFDIRTSEAWEAVLSSSTELLARAGEISKQGFNGVLRKLKENGTWELQYITLMPDLIYLYKDSQKTDLYGQFPLVDVTVQFPQEQSPSPHCFLLNSSHPPFLLTLSALDEKQYSQWLFQIDWRVKALQVVRKDRENESDSLTSVEDALVTKKEWLTKPPRKVQNSLTKERPQTPQELMANLQTVLDAGLPLTIADKELIRKSWSYLTAKKWIDQEGMSKSGIGKLFENFYSKLFEADTTAKRLFEGTGMKAQGRALVNMIGIVVKSLDNWSVFSSIVLKLAGRHQIYGVKQKSYDIFAEILSDTIAQLCDDMPDTNVSHVQTLWKKVICTLSDLIVQAYPIASLPFSIVSSRKLLVNNVESQA
eukprot:TRINITY_DN4445_c0_g1_i32.p1 TRINITY_DN4445_c0_g1~~TRINITY_DN4445_c0_g1_i32.p1  ORF type:complete len:595 (+),score=95.69 TRINITY_DN4445_c0_g1_i32:82-1866(+)